MSLTTDFTDITDPNVTTKNTEITEGFRQDEQNFQNRGKGISEIEGKVARVAMSEGGSRASFNRGNGFPR
jgi:hypothetical protein